MTFNARDMLRHIRQGDRRALAKAITLIEGQTDVQRKQSLELLTICHREPQARVISISGPPGAGKSTLIESLGRRFLAHGPLGILAIDPSSEISGGSLLADKTRMTNLAASEEVFIRPCPSRGFSGGLSGSTFNAMILASLAGFKTIIIESVGTGQTESDAYHLSDIFIVLHLPGSGDDLQAMKKGVSELADLIVVNKCDGTQKADAERAYNHLNAVCTSGQKPISQPSTQVVRVSCKTGQGIEELHSKIEDKLKNLGETAARNRRKAQNYHWFKRECLQEADRVLNANAKVISKTSKFKDDICAGKILPMVGAARWGELIARNL